VTREETRSIDLIFIALDISPLHPLFSRALTVTVAERPEEIKALLEVGFEYVCQKDSLIFLRKRK